MTLPYRLEALQLSCLRQQRPLFTPLSFQVSTGEALIVQGPNGSGKSSLLRLLTGLATPASGDVLWSGHAIRNTADYGEHLHYVSHLHGIKRGLTVIENLRLAEQLSASPASIDKETVLSPLQLKDDQKTLAKHLSAGQQRRLALAKLFLFPKPLWLLDEPFTALDSSTQLFCIAQVEHHLKKGGIAIISTHHPLSLKNISVKTIDLTPC